MRANFGLILGPALAALVWSMPLGLSGNAAIMAGVVAWVVCWWIFEAIPLAATALFGAILPVILGVTDPKTAFAPFAHPLIFLFMGGFLLARAMRVHGMDRRVALIILSRRWVAGSPLRGILALWGTTALFSFWLSNTATTAMMLPIAIGILQSLFPQQPAGREKGLITLAYFASIGGLATPVGSPPNVIAMGMLQKLGGVNLTFLDWMLYGVPVALGCLAVATALGLNRVSMPDVSFGREETLQKLRGLGPLSLGERNSMGALFVAVLFWVGPGVYALFAGKSDPLYLWWAARFPDAVVAMMASLLLFLLPAEGGATLQWKEAVQIDWSALLLFGGGLSLGTLMFATGLAEGMGTGLLALVGDSPFWFMVVAVYFTIFFTEATSNTASGNLLIPLVIAVCVEAGRDPLIPVLGVSMACSLAFMLPVATPPNAIVYGTGEVRLPQMMRMGFSMNLLCGLVLLGVLGLASVIRGFG